MYEDPRSNEQMRREDCRPLTRDSTDDGLFFCGLGTLWCTEGHGDLVWQGSDEWQSREAAPDTCPCGELPLYRCRGAISGGRRVACGSVLGS